MTSTYKILTWLGAAMLILAFSMAAATDLEKQSLVRSASDFEAARAADGRHVLPDEHTEPSQKGVAATKGSAAGHRESATCCDHYIYSGFTELFDDFDGDGFYTYLRINVDVDTDWLESDVYLKAFLRSSIGGWQKIHTSNVFTVHGTSSFDDYEIETELVSGFAADYYDVLVEVYEADSGFLVAEYGPAESSSFSLRPLEDINRDGVLGPPIVDSYGSSGGGSLSPAWLLLTAALGAMRARRYAGKG